MPQLNIDTGIDTEIASAQKTPLPHIRIIIEHFKAQPKRSILTIIDFSSSNEHHIFVWSRSNLTPFCSWTESIMKEQDSVDV